jgi:hypothetical protein
MEYVIKYRNLYRVADNKSWKEQKISLLMLKQNPNNSLEHVNRESAA